MASIAPPSFSILASDRWVEAQESLYRLQLFLALSVSSPRIVGLKRKNPSIASSSSLHFQYPRLGSLG